MTTPNSFAVFHLNLSFSAVSVAERPKVITKCYEPLLDLMESQNLPLGIECNAWSLEEISRLRPQWLERLSQLLADGKAELIGSGYVQMIGPLIPHELNLRNQQLGLKTYQRLLNTQPKLALVNEMAFSSGLVDLYAEVGYQGIIMERQNIQLALGEADEQHHAAGLEGANLPVLWSDSILFQKLQRLTHGEIDESDYFGYLARKAPDFPKGIPIYCSDAEIFDYRPRRYHYEISGSGEWQRMGQIFAQIQKQHPFTLPSNCLPAKANDGFTMNSAVWPVPVKKQPKYNISRWAVSGRDDLFLNTSCHRLLKALLKVTDETKAKEGFRRLCLLWSSDLRTHIHEQRWQQAQADLTELEGQLNITAPEQKLRKPIAELPPRFHCQKEGLFLKIKTDHLALELNLRRGLAIRRLGFASHDFRGIVGTLPHGHFEPIDLGADFYTGHLLIEQPADLHRLTDLNPVQPAFLEDASHAYIRALIPSKLGDLIKTITIARNGEEVGISYEFPQWQRPFGTIRLGHVTLLPDGWRQPIELSCCNGGRKEEHFLLDRDCDHGRAISGMISCTTGLGATSGKVRVSDGRQALDISWDPASCAAMPMLLHRRAQPDHLTRLVFSLGELDDTRTSDGRLLPFAFTMRPGT